MEKNILVAKVDEIQHQIWTESSEKEKELKALNQEVSDMNLTSHIITAILSEIQSSKLEFFEGQEFNINVGKIFYSHQNNIRFDDYKEEIKRTIENKCDWITLDLDKKIFVIKLTP